MEQVFRQLPSDYIRYVVEIIGVQADKSFLDYYELAATRDLVVHNSLVINELYIENAEEGEGRAWRTAYCRQKVLLWSAREDEEGLRRNQA